MGIETKSVYDLEDIHQPQEALLGNSKREIYPKNTVWRVFVGCLNDADPKTEFEALLTKSFQCQNVLKNPGDLAVLDVSGTFDKDGCYHVVARYAIIPEPVSK